MFKLATPHLLTGEELTGTEIQQLIDSAIYLKQQRGQAEQPRVLAGKHLALVFDKPSLRTRLSFTIAARELGGDVIESVGNSRKVEDPADQMRVLQGYCHAVMVRTFSEQTLEKMQEVARVPIINGLSDLYHPCQILADLMTLKENFGSLENLSLCYIGDGNNILHSLLLMASAVGVNVHYYCPKAHGPNARVLRNALNKQHPGAIKGFDNIKAAVAGCHAVYTDVWTSMGFESTDERAFKGFQVNEALMQHAQAEAIFLHCMPMERGKEVSHSLPDSPCSKIFQQSENRLHVQKALLLSLFT